MLDKKGGGGKIGYQKILEKVIHISFEFFVLFYEME